MAVSFCVQCRWWSGFYRALALYGKHFRRNAWQIPFDHGTTDGNCPR